MMNDYVAKKLYDQTIQEWNQHVEYETESEETLLEAKNIRGQAKFRIWVAFLGLFSK